MEWKFEKNSIACLYPVKAQSQAQEQTQELRLGEAMPEAGSIIGAWGQPVIRGKQWQSDTVTVNYGVMVWVLYAPEDGSQAHCVEAWLPMSAQWELDGAAGDGTILCQSSVKAVDARILSGRKIMLRATTCITAVALTQTEYEIYEPQQVPEDIQLRRLTKPVSLAMEAGEKPFLLDEELSLPASAPAPDRILRAALFPQITEQRVLGNKVVFRGSCGVHLLYRTVEGAFSAWDTEIPFSQYSELSRSYTDQAQAQLLPAVTALETEQTGQGTIRLKAGLCGQYVIYDTQTVSVITDAYSPFRPVTVCTETVQLPAICPLPEQILTVQQTVAAGGSRGIEAALQTGCCAQRNTDLCDRQLSGAFRYLIYDTQGQLSSGCVHWEQKLPQDTENATLRWCMPVGDERITTLSDSTELTAEIRVYTMDIGSLPLEQVTGLTAPEQMQRDPTRPSLVLERAGERELWTVAKENGSTVEAIQQANQLLQAPEPDHILLIPVL